jgi:putative oxidoreductase
MNVMKLIPTIARYLLGLIFVVFGLNFWLQFLEVPQPPEGSLAAGFIGAIYMSGFLAVVKVFEVVGGILLLSGRYVNLALAVVGPIAVVIVMYHVLILEAGYAMAAIVGILAITALAGRRDFITTLLAPK